MTEFDSIFKKPKPSYHDCIFVVTRNYERIIIDIEQELYDCDCLDGNNLDDNLTDTKNIPTEPGIYSSKMRIYSYQSNNYDDPIGYDMDVTLEDIKSLGKPIDLIK